MSTPLFPFPLSDEPYRTIVRFFLASGARRISPQDSETRLFLGDIPVIAANDPDSSPLLLPDRSLFLMDNGSFLARAETKEQAEIRAAVGRFALFVHFFGEMLARQRAGEITDSEKRSVRDLLAVCHSLPLLPRLRGEIDDIERTRNALVEAGKTLVNTGLVDAIFGNLSCRVGETILISRTGTALDRLEAGIVSCPLDADDGKPFGASVEYPSHRRILKETLYRCVLHAHPRWTVIWSLAEATPTLFTIPVVEGMPGTDLARILPFAVSRSGAAIVRGHGVFAAGRSDLNEPLALIYRIERESFETYCKHFL